MRKVLAIDFGTKRIGVAVSRATLAEPLLILPNNEVLWSALQEIVAAEEADLVLVGMSEREMALKTQEFTNTLEKYINVPIQFIDETLSSKTVHQKLAHSHMKRSKRQQPIDHYVAAELLQEWLDTSA